MNYGSRFAIPVTLSFFALCTGSQAMAGTLDEKGARSLLSDRVWQQKKNATPGRFNFWSWKADGSVCLQLEERHSKCDDTGRWKLDGEKLCYELTWWGATQGEKAACFRISDKGNGRYEALQDKDYVLFEFSVIK